MQPKPIWLGAAHKPSALLLGFGQPEGRKQGMFLMWGGDVGCGGKAGAEHPGGCSGMVLTRLYQ